MKAISILILLALAACDKDGGELLLAESTRILFGLPQRANILGYDDHIMEPFISRDGKTLFFNNLNKPQVNTDLHLAHKINDSTFQYMGKLQGINTESLEAVPSLDGSNVLYFVSTRSYLQTYSSIYKGDFSVDGISNVQLVSGISKIQPGWVNFDVEISKDGNSLFTVDGRFDEQGGPHEANFVLAVKRNGVFRRKENDSTFKNINTEALEYAACISSTMLELYFTRVEQPLSDTSMPRIYVATRTAVDEPFGMPYLVEEASGFVEAPTISPDDQVIYYHKRENGKFVLYMTRKES